MRVLIELRKDGMLEVKANGKTYLAMDARVSGEGPGVLELSIPLGDMSAPEASGLRTMDEPPEE